MTASRYIEEVMSDHEFSAVIPLAGDGVAAELLSTRAALDAQEGQEALVPMVEIAREAGLPVGELVRRTWDGIKPNLQNWTDARLNELTARQSEAALERLLQRAHAKDADR